MGRLLRRRTIRVTPYSARNALVAGEVPQCSLRICVEGGKHVVPDKIHLSPTPCGDRSPGAGGRTFLDIQLVVRHRLSPPCLLEVEEWSVTQNVTVSSSLLLCTCRILTIVLFLSYDYYYVRRCASIHPFLLGCLCSTRCFTPTRL